MKSVAEPKQGFWEVLARKAKGVIEDNDGAKQFDSLRRAGLPISETPPRGQVKIILITEASVMFINENSMGTTSFLLCSDSNSEPIKHLADCYF